MEKQKGFFVAFEGIDGAGKFTQLQKTKEWLEELGKLVKWSSEPNDVSPLGGRLRKILKHELPKPDDPVEFQRMYILDRAQDIFVNVQPTLDEGKVYLMERFALSTIAYGMLADKSADFFIEMHRQILGSSMIWPDLTIILDLPAKTAMKRLDKDYKEKQLFEKEKILEQVRQNYLSLVDHPQFRNVTYMVNQEDRICAKMTHAIVIVDAEPNDPNIVFNGVMNAIMEKGLKQEIFSKAD